MVLVRNHPVSSAEDKKIAKFYPKWLGPYKVVEKLTPVSYRLEINDRRILPVQVIQNLKPFVERNSEKRDPIQSIPDADKEIPVYEPPTTRKKKLNFRQIAGLSK
jgi:hypothetical protein